MKKLIVCVGVFLVAFVFLTTYCSASLLDPTKPRKTGASIYKNRKGAAKPAVSTSGAPQKEQPAMVEAMKNQTGKYSTGSTQSNKYPTSR